MTFIDIGCYDGDTVEQFINWGQLIGDISDSTVYAFDPINYVDAWKDIHDRHIKHVKNIVFDRRAAWIEDTTLEFSPARMGSTVMKEKNTWNSANTVQVPAFDFSTWLQNVNEDIYIKLDCEGAEYPILEKMIQDGTDKKVKLMFIEWHAEKMGQFWKNKEEWVKQNLNCRWLEWR